MPFALGFLLWAIFHHGSRLGAAKATSGRKRVRRLAAPGSLKSKRSKTISG